ncbi:MAG: response regulator [Pseudomonadota bacterium]
MGNSAPVNILLVDDDPANLLSLQVVLGPLGENLVSAGSGREALKHLLRTDFAAVLLDVRMPGMSGFEVAQLIRERPRSNRTPILFLTAADDADHLVEQAYALGAVDFLRKPLNAAVLKSKIGIFVDLYRKTADITRLERERHEAAMAAKDSRLRLILDNTKDYAFIGTDRDGVIREWEGGAEAITGWRPSEAIGQPLSIIFTPADVAAGQPVLERQAAQELGRTEDKRWHHGRDGVRFYADGVVVALNDADGELHGFAKIFRNATAERKAADAVAASEERLRESEERVRLATRAGGLGVWTWVPDVSDNIIWENELPYEIFGRHQAAPPPTKAEFAAEYLEADDLLAFEHAIEVALSTDSAFSFQGRFKKPGDPKLRWIELTGRYHGATASRPAQLLGTVAEITERKESEERLRTLAADLSSVDQRKTEFLATLAHELRNPLAPLVNGLAIMAREPDNPGAVSRVREIMQRQVGHMVHLIDDLLDVARINGGKIELKKQRVALSKVIANAIETSQPLIDAARHQLNVRIPPEPITLEVDPVRIAQVLSNMLNNAAKYTPAGGRIDIEVERGDATVAITIRDNGVGIPQEAQHEVFNMFNQVDRHLERAQGGLGIGLALVQRLVSMHEGEVSVASPGAGLGSAFAVRLPLVPEPPAARAPAPAAAGGAPARLRALVVDDNDDAAQTLATLLDILGHDVATANDGLGALSEAQKFGPDVIFLDIGMPLMNGYEAAAALRKMPGLAHVTLVALTGWGSEQDMARSKAAGFDRHLLKPVAIDALVELLAAVQKQA